MRETDPIHDAFRRFEDTDPHGVRDRNNAINNPITTGLSCGGGNGRPYRAGSRDARCDRLFLWAIRGYSDRKPINHNGVASNGLFEDHVSRSTAVRAAIGNTELESRLRQCANSTMTL
jgi:hypothetical protein